jgi:TRAP-type C4-dicarboxylate transport system permease small subunit
MEKMSDNIEKFIELLCVILMAILAITVIFGVITRNIDLPIVWLGELATFCCIWVTFLGMSLAYRKRLFSNVDIITHAFKERGNAILAVIWDVIGLLFLVIVLVSSKSFISYLLMSGHKSGELRIPFYLVYSGPIAGYLFTAYYVVVSLTENIINLIEKGKSLKEITK